MSDKASKLKGLVWIVAAIVFAGAFAFGLAPIAHAIPWSWEKKLGNWLNGDPSRQPCAINHESRDLMKRLVARLYPIQPGDSDFSIDVNVVRDPEINAYAELGGSITVNSGLLKQAQSPEEVAGVLAHEMGHVQHRHIMQGALREFFTSQGLHMVFGDQPSGDANLADFFLSMSFSRGQEAQADKAGLARLQAAHIDNKGFRNFFERMGRENTSPEFLSDHPSDESRFEMAESFANKDVKPIMTPEEWKILKNYCSK